MWQRTREMCVDAILEASKAPKKPEKLSREPRYRDRKCDYDGDILGGE
jgi:hypothetical protein